MKIVFLLYFGVLAFTIRAQSYNDIVKDSVIHTFMESVLFGKEPYGSIFNKLPKKVYYKPIHLGEANWDLLNKDTTFEVKFRDLLKFDSIFSKQDYDFIKRQYYSLKESIWKLSFKKIRFVKEKKAKLFEYSIPLFSYDYKRAIFWRFYYKGPVWAYSELHAYKLVNGKWVIDFIISGWIAKKTAPNMGLA